MYTRPCLRAKVEQMYAPSGFYSQAHSNPYPQSYSNTYSQAHSTSQVVWGQGPEVLHNGLSMHRFVKVQQQTWLQRRNMCEPCSSCHSSPNPSSHSYSKAHSTSQVVWGQGPEVLHNGLSMHRFVKVQQQTWLQRRNMCEPYSSCHSSPNPSSHSYSKAHSTSQVLWGQGPEVLHNRLSMHRLLKV
jgi:hypothetical protein